MNAIPFVKDFDFSYAEAERLSPLVQRVTARNPGPFTYTGTGVFIIGAGKDVAVIDPGPLLEEHQQAMDIALAGKTVTHVLATHHHIDHSPLAAPLAKKHGCKVYGFGQQPKLPDGGEVRLEAGDDLLFKPDIEIRCGATFKGSDWSIEAIHTPGHTSNHMCFALAEEKTLFSGDHIMGWSTSVVSPPDGHMGDYLRCLNLVKDRKFDIIRPTHGPAITETGPFVQAYIDHRLKREAQILETLKSGLSAVSDMVGAMYADIDKRLHPAAAHSILAHLIHLTELGKVTCEGDLTLKGVYSLA